MDFPGDCPTNAYILDGFATIAYMVSTVAGHGPGSEASTVSLLKNAELELRSQASILVSLDLDTNELFTFYRTIDIQRDGKAIFGKLAAVLRHNSCINSFKSTIRAAELLKDEHSRLYSFFIMAVFLALKPNFVHKEDVLPLGFRTFIQLNATTATPTWPETESSPGRGWTVQVIDLQLLGNGQLFLINKSRVHETLFPLSALVDLKIPSDGNGSSVNPFFVALAPTGQLARYRGRIASIPMRYTENSRPSTGNSTRGQEALEDARWRSWRSQLKVWLIDQGCRPGEWGSDDSWVQVELPFLDDENRSAARDDHARIVWKTVLWPSQLCFCAATTDREEIAPAPHAMNDPLAFVQHWLLTSQDRARDIVRDNATEKYGHGKYGEGHDLEGDDDEFETEDSTQLHPHLSADLPPSQMMYPTPPDAPYTQPTPGMSSIDGIAMTPADNIRAVSGRGSESFGVEISDNIEASGVGTGMYDGDLFEDMPEDQFGASGVADEPNWDFFDQPDMEMTDISVEVNPNDIVEDVEQGLVELNGDRPPTKGNDNSATLMPPPPLIDPSSTNAPEAVVSQTYRKIVGSETIVDVSTAVPDVRDSADIVEVPQSVSLSPGKVQQNSPVQMASNEIYIAAPFTPEARVRKPSLYETAEQPVVFDDHDNRYSADGIFWFDTTSVDVAPSDGALSDHGRRKRSMPATIMRSRHDADFSSARSLSDASEVSNDTTASRVSGHKMDLDLSAGAKRRWTEYLPTSPAFNQVPTVEELRSIDAESQQTLKLLRPENLDQTWTFGSLSGTFQENMSSYDEGGESGLIAQILVDQLSQSGLNHDLVECVLQKPKALAEGKSACQIHSLFGKIEGMTLQNLTQASDATASAEAASRMTQLEPNQINVFRTEKPLVVSSTALPLWDMLSLQPQGGTKNVLAFCVHPDGELFDASCDVFLNRIGETYIDCNLGTHGVGKIAGITNNGLVSWSDDDEAALDLRQCCERLGTALSRLPPSAENIMIYMLKGVSDPYHYIEICEAFYTLFAAYARACNGSKRAPNEIALQIVPLSFVASPDAPVIRLPSEYTSLAIEVYNRCPPSKAGEGLSVCGSATVIGLSPRRRIHFNLPDQGDLTSDPEGDSLHLAYSRSTDGRWITAAWTDQRGFLALIMSYYLGERRNRRRDRRLEVIRDLWEISQELMAKKRGKWRLVIGRNGFYDAEEINEWAVQLNHDTGTLHKSTRCTLILVSVDLDPGLALYPSPSQLKAAPGVTPQPPLNNYGTPASTPQASTTSPDQFLVATPTPGGAAAVNAPTPPENSFDPNNETDLSLVDPSEETWCAILPFGLNQSLAVLEKRPALISGYLLKRQGTRDEDGLAMLGASLIYLSTAAATQTSKEDLLRDILAHYRGLVTLARTRGCIDPTHEVVPWHVATAVKGARVLGRLM